MERRRPAGPYGSALAGETPALHSSRCVDCSPGASLHEQVEARATAGREAMVGRDAARYVRCQENDVKIFWLVQACVGAAGLMGLASMDQTCQGTIVSATPPSGTGAATSPSTDPDVCVYTATSTGSEDYCCGCAQMIAGNAGSCPALCAPLCFSNLQGCAMASCPSECAGLSFPYGAPPASCAQCLQAKCPTQWNECATH